ncbi:ETC complex I subunit conserved region [alpha proteobacterium HIMB114]|nr:ETC complex I subunit conserved region [alpha proteobacterium HIMB114]
MPIIKKAKIYIPTKTATQSAIGNSKKWILKFDKVKSGYDHLMNWTSSFDTQSQVSLLFETKKQAIDYAKKYNIEFEIIEPKKNKLIIKSYADNFLS